MSWKLCHAVKIKAPPPHTHTHKIDRKIKDVKTFGFLLTPSLPFRVSKKLLSTKRRRGERREVRAGERGLVLGDGGRIEKR